MENYRSMKEYLRDICPSNYEEMLKAEEIEKVVEQLARKHPSLSRESLEARAEGVIIGQACLNSAIDHIREQVCD